MHRIPRIDGRRTTGAASLLVLSCLAAAYGPASAHHTYAMFASDVRTLSGTVAKLEWKNPHVFVWVYVPDPQKAGSYTLWALENGSPSVLSGFGWNKDALKYGDRLTVDYWPLKDGKVGGHFKEGRLSNGRVLRGAGGPGQ